MLPCFRHYAATHLLRLFFGFLRHALMPSPLRCYAIAFYATILRHFTPIDFFFDFFFDAFMLLLAISLMLIFHILLFAAMLFHFDISLFAALFIFAATHSPYFLRRHMHVSCHAAASMSFTMMPMMLIRC